MSIGVSIRYLVLFYRGNFNRSVPQGKFIACNAFHLLIDNNFHLYVLNDEIFAFQIKCAPNKNDFIVVCVVSALDIILWQRCVITHFNWETHLLLATCLRCRALLLITTVYAPSILCIELQLLFSIRIFVIFSHNTNEPHNIDSRLTVDSFRKPTNTFVLNT